MQNHQVCNIYSKVVIVYVHESRHEYNYVFLIVQLMGVHEIQLITVDVPALYIHDHAATSIAIGSFNCMHME